MHGGRVDLQRPRVRAPDGPQELELAGRCDDGLGRWAMYQRRISVSTRRFRRSVCLPEDASTALYWTAAGMLEAKKSCRRLKADKQLPALKAALSALQAARSAPVANDSGLASMSEAA